jgi:hypothetical protein
VDPPLSTRLPLEVFDRIRDVGLGAVDAGLLERLVEDLPGRADEGLALAVLLVAWLLTDHHHVRLARALAKDRLRRFRIERAATACLNRLAEGLQREVVGEIGGSAHGD